MAVSSKIQKTKSSKNLNGNTASTRRRDVIVRSSGKFTGIPKQPKSQKAPQSQTRTRTRARSQTNSNGKLQSTTVKNTEPIKFKKEPVELTSNSKKLTGNPLFQALSPETTNKTKNNSSSLSHNPLFQALKSDSNTKKDVKLSSNPLFKVLSSSTSKVTNSNSNNKNSKNLIEKKSSTSKSSALEKLLKSGGGKGKDSISDALRNTKNKKPLNPLEQALKGKFSGNNSRSKKPNDGNDRDRNNNRNNNKNNNRNSDNNNNNRNDNRNNDRNNNRNGSSNRNSRSNRTNINNNNNNNNNINNFDNNNNVSNGFTSGSADLSFVNAADIRFLRIRNLKPGVNEGDVIIVMSQIGPVRKILLKESSKSTVAEVFFQNDTDTVFAYTKLNNKSADGRTLKCEIDNKSTIIQDKDYWNHFVASLSHQRGL